MTNIAPSAPHALPDALYASFADNLCRHIIGVARACQRRLMQSCSEAGFASLKLSFGQVLPFVPPAGIRIGELAQLQGVSKQAMSQLVKELEALGYVHSEPELQDRRVRRVTLTERGNALRRQANQALTSLADTLEHTLGQASLSRVTQQLLQLAQQLAPTFPWAHAPATGGLVLALGVAAQHCSQRLMEMMRERGHPGLKMSYGGVLTHLGREGARINELAAINDISKQAIAQLVAELERLDYVHCLPDPSDGRAKRVFLGSQGLALIRDSVVAAEELLSELGPPMTAPDFAHALRALYDALCSQEHLTSPPTEEGGLNALLQQWWNELAEEQRERWFCSEGARRRLSDEALQKLKAWSCPDDTGTPSYSRNIQEH